MVEANFNRVDASEYPGGGGDGPLVMGKQKRGGVGGKGSKSHDFKEAKNANIRRNAKIERETAKEEAKVREAWV